MGEILILRLAKVKGQKRMNQSESIVVDDAIRDNKKTEETMQSEGKICRSSMLRTSREGAHGHIKECRRGLSFIWTGGGEVTTPSPPASL